MTCPVNYSGTPGMEMVLTIYILFNVKAQIGCFVAGRFSTKERKASLLKAAAVMGLS